MPNPKGHEDSIKDSRFKAAWQSGPTRTIRVPIALANATLDYARQLDKKNESRDTADSSGNSQVETKQPQSRDTADSSGNSQVETKQPQSRDTADSSGNSQVETKQPQSRDTSGSINEVKRLKGECKRLQKLVSDMRIELYHTRRPEIELPEAADLLNRLKAKRKKSAVTLADIEAILEMIEG
ncbi:hypothetical protein Q5691_26655 [Microcoleus sp. w1-18aA5]|uniref:hypothetical protein n=1 Tax=Microcoleus sp. w1-18aA5 TaxID=2818982 RepID=UPI002FD22054